MTHSHLLVSSMMSVGLLMASAQSTAQSPVGDYPARTVRVVVPYSPGGGNDILARTVVAKGIADLGQNTVVDNRAGGNTTIGTQIVARASPDGYTLLIMDNAFTIAPSVQVNLPYDALKDFARITMIAMTSPVLVVHPTVAAKSVKELIALTKAQPGRLSYGTTGSGTTAHLAFGQIKLVTGLDAVHVPYKGGAPQITALLSGEVSMLLSVPASLLAQIKAGRMRPLAVSGAKRLPSLPEIPTLQETGIPVVVESFWGLVAPAGTPAAIISKVQSAVAQVLKAPEIRGRLDEMQFQPVGSTPAQFEEFVQSEVKRWIGVVKATGVKVD